VKDLKFELNTDQKSNIVELYQNNYVERSNYFNSPTKLFSDLYPAKF